MTEFSDYFIARSLKNWVATYKPPENQRGRLLLQAAANAYPFEQPLYATTNGSSQYPKEFFRNHHQESVGLFAYSRLWFYCANISVLQII